MFASWRTHAPQQCHALGYKAWQAKYDVDLTLRFWTGAPLRPTHRHRQFLDEYGSSCPTPSSQT